MTVRVFANIVMFGCLIAARTERAVAQETIISASVSGRVTDPQGGVVPGAQVLTVQVEFANLFDVGVVEMLLIGVFGKPAVARIAAHSGD